MELMLQNVGERIGTSECVDGLRSREPECSVVCFKHVSGGRPRVRPQDPTPQHLLPTNKGSPASCTHGAGQVSREAGSGGGKGKHKKGLAKAPPPTKRTFSSHVDGQVLPKRSTGYWAHRK